MLRRYAIARASTNLTPDAPTLLPRTTPTNHTPRRHKHAPLANFSTETMIGLTGLDSDAPTTARKIEIVFIPDGNFTGRGSFSADAAEEKLRRGLSPFDVREFVLTEGKSAEEIFRNLWTILDEAAEKGAEIVLVGSSSGGFVAARCGNHPSVVGVVTLASPLLPFTRGLEVPNKRRNTFRHFEGRAFPSGTEWKPDECPKVFKAQADLVSEGCRCPMLAIVGKRDEAVPEAVWGTEDYRAVLKGGTLKVTDKTHGEIYKAPREILEMVREWISSLDNNNS